MSSKPHYTVRKETTPVPASTTSEAKNASEDPARETVARDPFVRPANEDDDGYDPYSDRPPTSEPLFQEDPWS